jgi:membrane-associated phospholipid phosphatase
MSINVTAVFAAAALLGALADARASEAEPAGLVRDVEATPRPETSARPRDEGRRTLSRLPVNVGRGLVGVFHPDNVVPLIAGATATAAASFFDDETRDAVVSQFDWGDEFETAGGPIYSSIFVVGMFTAGRFAHGERFRAMTYDMLDAAVVNFTYTAVIKAAVGRERPNGQDAKSFPSGHTSNAFAMATVAERHYGWKLGVPAYLLAGLMGASRVNEDKHWLSDVFAGATLGFVAGRTVVRVNGQSPERGARATWSVAPVVARRTRGVQMTVMF